MHKLIRYFLYLYLCLYLGLFSSQVIAADIIVLDVGEGQSVLVHQDGRGLLIDTGHAGQAVNILHKLAQWKVNRLEALVITHLHPDHASAYFRLKEAYPAAIIYSNCHPLPANIQPDMTRWVASALKQDKLHRCLKQGERIKHAGVVLDVLWPAGFKNANLNHHSLVLMLYSKGTKVLLMGDADHRAEAELIKSEQLSPVKYLVVGHHGASDATSNVFLDVITPEQAIISVNQNNIRGYPSAQVIDNLRKRNIEVRRTDQLGDIPLND